MTDQELKDLVASLAIESKKTDEQLRKTDEQLKKTDEQLSKLSREFEEERNRSRKEFEEERRRSRQEFEEGLKRSRQEFEEELKRSGLEFDKRMEKLENKLNKIGSMLGSISNNQGNITEEYFVNSLKDCLRVGSIDFDYLIENFVAKNGHNTLAEYDILLVNGESVAIVEVKYKAHIKDLEKLPRKIEELKNLPQYRDYRVYAGIATFFATNELIKRAEEQGYFILQRKGDIVITHAQNLKVA